MLFVVAIIRIEVGELLLLLVRPILLLIDDVQAPVGPLNLCETEINEQHQIFDGHELLVALPIQLRLIVLIFSELPFDAPVDLTREVQK